MDVRSLPTHLPRKQGFLKEERKGKRGKGLYVVTQGSRLEFFQALSSSTPVESLSLCCCDVRKTEKVKNCFVLVNNITKKSRLFVAVDESEASDWVKVLSVRLSWIGQQPDHKLLSNQEKSGYLFVDGKEYWCALVNHRFRYFENEGDTRPVKSYLLSNVEVFPAFVPVIREGTSERRIESDQLPSGAQVGSGAVISWKAEDGFVLHHAVSDVRRVIMASCATDLEEWLAAFVSWDDDSALVKAKLQLDSESTKLKAERMHEMQGYLLLEDVSSLPNIRSEFWFVLKDGHLSSYDNFMSENPSGAFLLVEYSVYLTQSLSDERSQTLEKDDESDVEDDDDVREALSKSSGTDEVSADKVFITVTRKHDNRVWKLFPTSSESSMSQWARCFEMQRTVQSRPFELEGLSPPSVSDGAVVESSTGPDQAATSSAIVRTVPPPGAEDEAVAPAAAENGRQQPGAVPDSAVTPPGRLGDGDATDTTTVSSILSLMSSPAAGEGGATDAIAGDEAGKTDSVSIASILEEVQGIRKLDVVDAPLEAAPAPETLRGTLRKKKDKDEDKNLAAMGGEKTERGDTVGAKESLPAPFAPPKHTSRSIKEYECVLSEGCVRWSDPLRTKVLGSAVVASHWLLLPASYNRVPGSDASRAGPGSKREDAERRDRDSGTGVSAGKGERKREKKDDRDDSSVAPCFGLEHVHTQKQTYFFAPSEEELSRWVRALKLEGVRVYARDGEFFEIYLGHTAGIRCCVDHEGILYSGSNDRTIRAWRIRDGECIGTFAGHAGAVTAICASKKRLFTASLDRTLRVWDLESGDCLNVLTHRGDVMACCIDDKGRLISGAWTQDLYIWDVSSGSLVMTLPVSKERDTGKKRVTFSDETDGKGEEGSATDSKPTSEETVEGHSGSVDCCAVVGNILVSGSWDTTLRSWDLVSGESLVRFDGHTASVSACSVSNGILYSASWDQTLRSWNLRTGSQIHEFVGHTGWIRCCCVWDGLVLFSGSDDKTIRAWNVVTGKCIYTFAAHANSVQGVCVGLGDTLFSCSRDGAILAWRIGFLKALV